MCNIVLIFGTFRQRIIKYGNCAPLLGIPCPEGIIATPLMAVHGIPPSIAILGSAAEEPSEDRDFHHMRHLIPASLFTVTTRCWIGQRRRNIAEVD